MPLFQGCHAIYYRTVTDKVQKKKLNKDKRINRRIITLNRNLKCDADKQLWREKERKSKTDCTGT